MHKFLLALVTGFGLVAASSASLAQRSTPVTVVNEVPVEIQNEVLEVEPRNSREPFQVFGFGGGCNSFGQTDDERRDITVPDGKVGVIEFFSARITNGDRINNEPSSGCQVRDRTEGNQFGQHFIPAGPMTPLGIAVAASPMSMYLRSGHFVKIICDCVSRIGGGGMEYGLSGYFIDVDQVHIFP